MVVLYYLIDQEGTLDGDKFLRGNCASLEAAIALAAAESVAHFSVEKKEDQGAQSSIIYIV